MTATLTNVTMTALGSNTYDGLWFARIVVILLLLALMAFKELMRAGGSSRSTKWIGALNIAIVPLLLTFGFFIVIRLLELLG